ncbi:MAG: hypothetical protein QE285_21370 [Aquabacterium sp.]|nr:hypothetical protein [Aquabacterium sp.]
MLTRIQEATVLQRMGQSPAVVLLGSRQVGKTTLAHQVATHFPGAVVLDMERESDRAAMSQPELYLATVRDRLVQAQCLSETAHGDSVRWHRLGPLKAASLCRSKDHLRTTPIVHDHAETASTIRLKRRPRSR